MIKTETLRTFAEVARQKNLVRAAEALGRTPSAVSMTLKSLEEHLGHPLFEGERKTRLTALGAFALEAAERELAHHDRTVAALEDFAAGRSGEVRLAAVPSVATLVLPAVALDFASRHPAVRLELRDLDSASILRELDRGRIDLGVVSDAPEAPEISRSTLGSDRYGAVVAAGSPLAGIPRLTWQALADQPLLASPLAERVTLPELRAPLAAARLSVHNTSTLLAMVEAGLGLTVLPELVTRRSGRRIAFVPLEDPPVHRQLHLVRRRHETQSPATRAFADTLRRSVAQHLDAPPPDA